MNTSITKLTVKIGTINLQYDGQYRPQTAYVSLHQDGTVDVEVDYEIGDSTPGSVWNRVVRRFPLPATAYSKAKAKKFVKSIEEDLLVVVAGMGDEWDGSNWVGTLTDEALESLEAIEDYARSY